VRSIDLGEIRECGLVLPYARISAQGDVGGQESSATRSGMADPVLRLAINLIGAPALSPEKFREYRRTPSSERASW